MPTPATPYQRRCARLKQIFRKHGIDGLLVASGHNVHYLSGFTGDDSALLVTRGQDFFLTDSRYTEQAGVETSGLTIVTRKKSLMAVAAKTAQQNDCARLGVEAANITLAAWNVLNKHAGSLEVHSTTGLVENLRVIKDAAEIRAIKIAITTAEDAFAETVKKMSPGMTERQVALMLDRAMQDRGAVGPSFPSIVAAGERSSLPHARPTSRKIRANEAVLFDWGALQGHYCSDMTRVVFMGKIPPFFKRLYPIVLEAQRRAIRAIRPGREAKQVDAAARDYLKTRRHGKHFGHGLGHGVGLQIHEAPVLGPKSKALLKPGTVFTVEPGVYLPGKGGVRIEDMAVITRKGHRVLTSLPKALQSWVV